MSAYNLFSPDSFTVTSNIQGETFIPEQVVRVMSRKLADSAKAKILGRVSRGKIVGNPDGTGPVRTDGYSAGSRSFPMERMGDASRTRSSRYEAMMGRVGSLADGGRGSARTWRSSSGNPWIYIPGGYSNLRRMAGLPASNVTLSFTGRMLEDLVVKPVIERYGESGMTKAATMVGGGKIGGGTVGSGFQKSFDLDFDLADVIASIGIRIGFSTQSSWRVAKWQGQRYGHYFALLTPKEKQALRVEGMRMASRARERYGTDAPSFAPQNSQGFVPIDL